MPKILTAAEAAAEIRPEYDRNLGHDIPPETRHEHAYISEVCAALGVEASHAAIAHVRNLLLKHDIQPHAMQEYPKWIHRGHDDPVLVLSKEDEANIGKDIQKDAPGNFDPGKQGEDDPAKKDKDKADNKKPLK